ncbi:MAG: polymer-forming cytoskeletal protein [Wenzhouxiangellaceae bacterium]|nr:polymer-forming cytoskeletal protein [Wenzhouxiangellaceae bacterium]
MFNKKESSDSETGSQTRSHGNPPADRPGAGSGARPASGAVATIGPSIRIDGDLKGEEDLVVEGQVKGTVQLKSNTLTVGSRGTLQAQVYAHTILVDGTVHGDLYASERIVIRKSARIDGNILAPRIALEDGARFRGTIDMDAESEAFRKAFGKSAGSGASPQPIKQAASGGGSGESKNPSGGASSSDKPGEGKVGGSAA